MRKAIDFGILLSLFLMLTAMGSIGGEPTGMIPTPLKNFQVTVIDRAGVTTKLSNVSFDDGKVFFVGKRGKAQITIDFEHIQKIALKSSGETLLADIQIKGGKQMQLLMESQKKIYGKIEVGTYEIFIGDLKELRFE